MSVACSNSLKMPGLLKLFARKLWAAVRLSPAEIVLGLQVCYWLVRVKWGLSVRPFRTVTAMVSRSARKRPRKAAPPAHGGAGSPVGGFGPVEIGWWVERVARHLPGSYSCLPRALTAHLLCRRRGYEPVLRVGALRDSAGELQAHAWLEFQGQIVIGDLPNLGDYQQFDRAEELTL